jgi:hypothetical protein
MKSNVRVLGVLLNQLEDSAVAYGTGKYGYGYGYYGRPEADVPAKDAPKEPPREPRDEKERKVASA